MEKYLDKSLSAQERAKDLLSKMNLDEKMAQTVSIYPNALMMGGDSVEVSRGLCTNGLGSVSTLEMRNIKSLDEVVTYQHRMQDMIMEQSPHHIPAMFHMEGLCGPFIQDSISVPTGINRAATFHPELETRVAKMISRQEKALGITQVLAPVLDISRDSRMGRQGETYGEDPVLASVMGVAYIKGIQNGERSDGLKADAVAKHFLGFHNSLGGIHGADSMTSPRLMQEVYGRPFQAAIAAANLHGVMPCYCTLDGEAASASKNMLTNLLREDMGFDGLSVSDYTAIENEHKVQGLFESLAEAGLKSMEAGMDMEWPKKSAYNDELKEWFATGKADIKILNTIVERILTAKFRMGLFEHPYALEGDAMRKEFFCKEDAEVSFQTAQESMILLKNDGVLPIKKVVKKIAVIGYHANNARTLFGGYTHVSMVESLYAMRSSIAGIDETGNFIMADYPKYPGTKVQIDDTEMFNSILPQQKPGCKSLLDQLKDQLPEVEFIYAYGYPVAGNDTSHFEEALEALKGADLCILTLGGKCSTSSISTMGEGVDSTDINLPECQNQFILEASKLGIPMVGVHFNGRPISSDAADEHLAAIIEAFAPAEGGAKAIVNVLTGAYNPCGKLPVSVAYNAGQIPIFYNHPMGSAYHQGASIGFAEYVDRPHTPRYFFGHGLSYTSFAYDNLEVSKESVVPDGQVEISLDVTNTGNRAGCEIVQLYLKDTHASMVRPCMELQGFSRVELEPGETKRVTFVVAPSQMAFLTIEMKWKIEKGEIQVLAGASAGDIRLSSRFEISEDAYIESKKRKYYATVL